ncbi:hypothetical protein CY34DRAFT_16918 [Suillus luteus UH-Slu-Lm8-n1]|uniref:CHAT domain-containing protein n=1 Tax=Suillus luteus UH-Slu-Lm8-n1 TaxID=930992 RepID=A0A0D0A1H8_9AGAM|nr:hypothetical protein CY34DRAFT_16918 [Suillus luteus UH-Slu-Lm8-n1]
MSGSSETRYIRLDVVSRSNLQVPSERMPAGISISINIDSQRRWKSATGVLSSEKSVVWGDILTLSSDALPVLSVEIRASNEANQMLGSGEACDDQEGALPDSLVDCEIARQTDAGHAQFAEYVASETVSHLNAAVEHFQVVLDQCPASHFDHAAALTNLAWARLEGYTRKHLQDIDTTISLFRDALALRPQHHPDRPLSLFNLTEALTWRYNKKIPAADIREAAQLYHELLPLWAGADYVIGGCNGLPTDASDEGICLRRVVLELCPVGHQHRPKALNELSIPLTSRFTRSGNIDDLDECIQICREAMSLCPEGHAGRDIYLSNLAVSLGIYHFRHQGNPDDLDEAISLHEEALRLRPVGHELRYLSLDNLGGVFLTHFREHGAGDDITRTISLYREALTLCPPGHPIRYTTLNNLALALKTRYDKLDVSEDLNGAIDLYRECLQLAGLDHPAPHAALRNLSSALCSRFTHTRKNEDIEEAIIPCQEILETLPPLHPDRFFSYGWLERAYTSRYLIQHNAVDFSLAVENSRLASHHSTQSFPNRIDAALNWVAAAESHQHDSAIEAYQVCLELFDSHMMTRSSIIIRREAAPAFNGANSLPVDAASCAIRCDNLRHAVELVEQGRGQQWSLASRLKTPVEDLESENPTLARNYLELSKRVSNATKSSATTTDRAVADRAATEYRRLTRLWEAAVAEIRSLKDFSRFLLPPAYEDLQAAARHGPIIIFIASKSSCSTIIVSTSGDPHHVPLSSIALADLNNPKERFTGAMRNASRMNPKQPRNDLIVLLRIVWNEIMLPVVNVLENVLKLKRCSRIWLCPTATFTSIPLHAANSFLTKADRSKEPCLEDRYICSYTPTLSALVRSRQLMKKRVTPSFVTMERQGAVGC